MALKETRGNPVSRPVVLIVCDYYLPGYESGGAMRTLVNMVDRLSDEFDFRIITRDHDGSLNRTPYTTVEIDKWNRVGNAEVFYLPSGRSTINRLKTLITAIRPDAIYLNSFFSRLTIIVLILRRARSVSPIPLVLAPEGEFSQGALTLKAFKKRFYIRFAKSLGLLRDIVWKAAADSEQSDIRRVLGADRHIRVAANLPPAIAEQTSAPVKPPKSAGSAQMIFLSRYMRKKNFNWILKQLPAVHGELKVDIYGTLEEADYWEEAQRLIAKLPDTISIESKGPLPHESVPETLARYHFFILPTLGENFGHVFIEALEAGCPLITSDRTPWRNLEEKRIGWDLPLEDPEAWIDILNKCVRMGDQEYSALSANSFRFAINWLTDPALEEANREVLRSSLGKLPESAGSVKA